MKKFLKMGMLLATLGVLVACGPKRESTTTDLAFPIKYENEKPVVELDTMTIAYVSDSPFTGIFAPQLYTASVDADFLSYINEQIFDTNADFEATDTGMAKINLNTEKNTVEITLREGLKWSDGHPMTVDDIIYTYEVIGSKDYDGVRYDSSKEKILGMKEYHEGKASTISGLEKISDTRLDIHFEALSAKMRALGDGMIGSVLPKHYLEGIPVKELASHDKVRKNPLSNGQYVITNVVPGESVEYVANEHYWLGKPKINRVIIKILQPALVIESMKQGEYFHYSGVPTDTYEKFKDLTNYAVIGRPSLAYDYIAFNLGRYDEEKKEVFQDRDTPFQDVRIRKAVGYAIDRELIGQEFYKGLRIPASTVTPPVFGKFYDKDLEGYFNYDPEKSKALLKEAGYEDTDKDGFVDKDGKPLVMKLALRTGSEIAEPLAQEFKQKIEDIGIKVEFTTGRLMDFNLWVEMVLANSNEIDAFVGAWTVGTSLDPNQSASRNAKYNLYRFVDEENDRLLAELSSPKTLTDPNYRAEAYKAWQKHYIEDLAVEIPLLYRYAVVPVNKNIKYYTLDLGSEASKFFTEVVDTKPAVHEIAK